MPRKKQHPTESKDSLREIVETVVFVVVLVLLLKSFVAEAFVIPTGSMATTLWGYQKDVECPKCHYVFPLNCSDEVEKGLGPILEGECPNCRYHIHFDPLAFPPETGDRVLVNKSLYDTFGPPNRFDVVVFKYPVSPQTDKHVQMNYIKRLVGLPGETIAIYGGDLYVSNDFSYGSEVSDAEQRTRMHVDDRDVVKLFDDQIKDQKPIEQENLKGKKFRILRKPPDKILSMQRIVYDNDFPAEDLPDRLRWQPEGESWQLDNPALPRRFDHKGGELGWIHYRHLLRDTDSPQLITDFMGYNSARGQQGQNWVADLVLQCDVNVEKAEGEIVLELSRGADRFQARFTLANNTCTLVRLQDGKKPETLASADSGVGAGTYRLRFANVDQRLAVWVDRSLIFGDGVAYDPPKQRGPVAANDLQPASIGVKGDVAVDHIKLFRDTYYTMQRNGSPSASDAEGSWGEDSLAWGNPNEWGPLRDLPVRTQYVQPEHFLCLGDNSPESSDGRDWGLVPRRLMLGRALLVYWPFGRAGPIR